MRQNNRNGIRKITKRTTPSHGYYHIILRPAPPGTTLLISNGERAYVVALLQDALSPRFVLSNGNSSLSSYIDLLAFSLTRTEVHLLVFAIDRVAVRYLAAVLSHRLTIYTNEIKVQHYTSPRSPVSLSITKLRGAHHALRASAAIHLRHPNWEYDRYSSIGFYLHDRRGDWMRIWRLTKLYDNNSVHYRQFIEHHALLSPHG